MNKDLPNSLILEETERTQDEILVSFLSIEEEPYILMMYTETEYTVLLKEERVIPLSAFGKELRGAIMDALLKEGIRSSRDIAILFLSPVEDI